MQHVAIDLGSRKSQVCVRAPDGTILQEKVVTNPQLEALLKAEPRSRVILETGSEAFGVADWALQAGHEVRVVPATLVRTLGVGSRRTKTDRRDAQVLSEVSCRIDLPTVHIPKDLTRERRRMCGVREELIASRTALINCTRGWARGQMLKVSSGKSETFPKRVRTTALNTSDGLPEYIERMLVVIDSLNEQIAKADEELLRLVHSDPLCTRLMSVPGVGPVTSMRFVAALDDIERFGSAHAVEGFLGLTPGENSSSQRQRRTGITKAGPAPVRRALVQAAWNVRRLCPDDPIARWANGIEQRRGKQIATVAVARKLAGILYALWRDGTTYNAQHSKSPSAAK